MHLKEVEPCRTKTHKNHMFFSLFCCFLHQEESLEHYASPLNQKKLEHIFLNCSYIKKGMTCVENNIFIYNYMYIVYIYVYLQYF